MQKVSKQNSAKSATIWNLIERFSSQLVAFAIGIVLARLLSPSDYGIVGMTTIFISLSNVFIDSGFANALIRKTDKTDADLSTAFYFNVIVGIVIYVILFLLSPFVSTFFNEPILTPILRVIGLNVVFLSLSIVQTAILTSNLNMRLQAIINLCSLIPAGLIAIFLAYNGAGVYALAIQTVGSSLIKMVLLWIVAGWRPKSKFNKDSFSYLWSFGSKLLGANIIGTIFNEIYSVLIGKYIGKADLGYYSKAAHLNQNIGGTATGVVQKVVLPILSNYQNDIDELRNRFSRLMRILVLFMAPLSAILFFNSKEIIVFLWSDKWVDCSIIFQLLIFSTMFAPISQLSLSLLQVVNRTDILLKLEFPKKLAYCFLIAIGFLYGVVGLAFVRIFINIIASVINLYPTKRILKYSYRQQLYDISKYMVISYLIGSIVSFISILHIGVYGIILYTIVFFVLYVVILILTKDELTLGFVGNHCNGRSCKKWL